MSSPRRSDIVRRVAIASLGVAVLLATLVAGPAGSADAAPAIPGRIAGDDRYATSAEIAKVWEQHFDGDTVFVATGENFPDALAASAAAAKLGAPVLLVKKNSLPTVVKNRINALKPKRIIVLGSSAAVSAKVVNALKGLSGSPSVVRWQGADRYATAATIIRNGWGVNGNGDGAEGVRLSSVVVTTGRNFPDAASAAAAVGATGGAVVLVDGSKSTIPSSTLNLLRDLRPQQIVIAGSTAAVKSGIESALRQAFGTAAVIRLGGPDRYATSALITDHYFDSAGTVFFATGEKFPDALTGAALAGPLGSPVLTARKSCVVADTASVVTALSPTNRVLLGSSAALQESVRQLKMCPAHSLDDPNSLWVVVNKKRPLRPMTFVPGDLSRVSTPYVNVPYLRAEAARATERMFADFQAQTGKRMQVLSSYRSYSAQQQVYSGNDLLTARPGYSEHQTGLAVDIDALPRNCSLQACFENTAQGKWLAQNAWKYGFILRYPKGLTHITGYQYEPWHFRYVGIDLATQMRQQDVATMEQFFGLPAAPNY